MLDRTLQIVASVLGLSGMALGSTTLYGAVCYAFSIPLIVYCVVIKRRAYGLLPLNIAQLVVVAFNIWRVV
jgi:hypothetical protein